MSDESGDEQICYETSPAGVRVFLDACTKALHIPGEPSTLWGTLAVVGALVVLIAAIASVRFPWRQMGWHIC